jgi:cytochrome c-type biogenesis protein CcmH/NrfF
LLLERGSVDVDDLLWAAPVALVLVGATAVAASLRRPARP